MLALFVAMLPFDAKASSNGLGSATFQTASWRDDLLQHLRDLTVILGGDPGDLVEADTEETWMQNVRNAYATNGVLNSLTQQQRIDGRATTEETYALLQAPPSNVDPNEVSLTLTILQDIYGDLGGDPGNLP